MGELVAALTEVKDALSILTPPEIKGRKDMSQYEIAKAMGGVKNITWLDSKYVAIPKAEFQKIIDWDWTDNKTYIAEKYDCENFSFSFKARVDRRFYINTVGLVIDYEAGHAYNVIIFANGSMKIFEPQSDGWPKIGSKLYKFNRETVEVII